MSIPYDSFRSMIHQSRKIVVFSGVGLARESGIPYFKDDGYAYNVELKYGISPEEFFSNVFYTTRPGQFFEYYKENILALHGEPNAAHYAFAKLEQMGKDVTVVTRSIYSLHQKAGSQKVIELYGSIYQNRCSKCGKEYSVDYIRNSHGMPYCETCQGLIRPRVLLSGDMLPNYLITQVADAVAQADMLIVAGTHLDSYLTKCFMQYYTGDKLVLINDEHHYTDEKAALVFHRKASEIMPIVIQNL